MKLSTLAAQTEPLTVKVGSETLNLVYRPFAFTRRFIEEITDAPAQFAALVDSWDLVDDEGAMVPITEEAYRELPVPLQKRINDALAEALLPNSQRTDAPSDTT